MFCLISKRAVTIGLFLFCTLFLSQLISAPLSESTSASSVQIGLDATTHPETISVLFAGDTHFIWGVEEMRRKEGSFSPVTGVADLFKQTQFRVINLETAIATKGTPVPQLYYVFNSPVDSLAMLRFLNVDLVTLGNNHSMDMGEDGMRSTIENLRSAGVASVGAGNNINEALAPVYANINGVRLAFFSLSAVGAKNSFATQRTAGLAYSQSRVTEKIAEAKKHADHIIFCIHWGIEYVPDVQSDQSALAKLLIDQGVSVVIGSHSHIPQAVELYRNGVIVYSLGNFLFGSVNYYQNQNLVAIVQFHKTTKQMIDIKLVPVVGTFREAGHGLNVLSFDESKSFWQEYYLQVVKQSDSTSKKMKFNSDGTANISIGQD